MNTTFKKSLLAVALTAATMSAQAVTLSATKVNLSFEGAANETSIANPNVTATIGSAVEYAAGDIITIDITGAKILAAANPTLTFAPAVGQPGDSASITYLSKTDTQISFRVASVTEGGAVEEGITRGGTLTLAGVTLDRASVLASATNKVTVTYSAKTGIGQVPIDTADTTGSDKFETIEVKTQLSAVVERKLNAVVDVEKDRQLFTNVTDAPLTPADNTTTDTLSVKVTNDAALITPAVLNTVAYRVDGDFSWMDADKNGTVSAGEVDDATTFTATADDTSGTFTLNTAKTQLSVTVTRVGTIDAEHKFTFTVPGQGSTKPLLNKQDYTVNATAAYAPVTGSATTKAVLSAAAAGSWTLNGSSVVVPYMVHKYGKFSNIINVHNSGSKEGAITIDVWDEAGNVIRTGVAAGTSKPGSIVSVVDAALNTLDITKDLNEQNKYSVRIITNVPAKDITVNSAYADVSGTTVTRTPVANDSAVQNKGNL